MNKHIRSEKTDQELLDALKQSAVPADRLTEGAKYDTGKVRLELVPPELLFAVGTILSFGAAKC